MAATSILLLDAGASFAWGVVRCLAEERDIEIHALARSTRIPLRYSRLLSSFHLWNGVLSPTAVEDVRFHARRVGADLLMAADETPIAFLANHGPSLGVSSMPVPTLRQFQIAQDKWELARFLVEHGLPHPCTTLCGHDEASVERIRSLKFPALVKPRLGGYGSGIRRFEEPEALLRHLASRPEDPAGTLAQSFLEGQDIDCSVLCRNGEILASTIQRPFTASPGFRPAGGVEFVDDARVLSLTADVVASLKWNGVAHFDLRYDAQRKALVVIEINPRFWGSLVGSLHAGVNFPALAVRAAAGESFELPESRACRYVAGATAMSYWRRGQFGSSRAGFRFADTVFRYALADPLPWITDHLFQPLPRLPIPYVNPHPAGA